MRLTGREVMQAVTETVIAQQPGEDMDWGAVAERLNECLAAGLVGRPSAGAPEFAGKHQRSVPAQ